MADFEKAYTVIAAHEGGYTNDENDRGGETYKGISRRFHPAWIGWERIDTAKQGSDFPNNLSSDVYLDNAVKRFYRKQYWDKFSGDTLRNQEVATELFDVGVNMGVRRAVRFLQDSLNLLNRNEQDYEDIDADGVFGPVTSGVLRTYLRQERHPRYLLRLMNILQGDLYVEAMRADPLQEKFARSWLSRT
jgi:lysozyme family protein